MKNPELERANALMKSLNSVSQMENDEELKTLQEMLSTETENKKIPIAVFEQIFLPMIQGKVESINEASTAAHWMGLVGATSPADVCDISGKTLFTIPPMANTEKIIIDKESKIGNVLTNYSSLAAVNPMRAKGELVSGLSSELDRAIDRKPSGYSWDGMLSYYGKLSPTESTKGSDIGFDFDDA